MFDLVRVDRGRSLYELVRVAEKHALSGADVASLLTELGIRDLDLAAILRAALARVPRAHEPPDPSEA